MKSRKWRTSTWPEIALVLAAFLSWTAQAPRGALAAGYMDAKALGKRLEDTAESHRNLMRVKRVARSLGERPVWLVELGRGSADGRRTRPAMLVVAGIEGNDLAGCAAAVTWIERLVEQYEEDDAVREILDTTTIYVFPRLNPDAAESFFAKPTVETSVSNKPADDDHDGMIDEDGPEDLNGDGWITWMRIEDPEGEYILDPDEPRLLTKADETKGEVGAWRYLVEGRDNDGDELWNEDGHGGVNFNRNFPYQYEWFAPASGLHQVSETATRALADFVVEHPNIGIIFTFGAADNLIGTPKGETGPSGGRGAPGGAGSAPAEPRGRRRAPRKAATAINADDLPYYRQMGEIYRKTLGLKNGLEARSQAGSFSDWMYFHRGRFSLAAQAWTPAMQLELEKAKRKEKEKEEEEKEEKVESEDAEEKKEQSATSDPERKNEGEQERGKADGPRKDGEEKRNKEDRAFLKWLDDNAPDMFVPWQAFDHPDFVDRRVEIGGFAPFAKTAPPEPILENLVTKHADFLTTLALRFPRIGIRKMESKHVGESVYEVEIQIENTGYVPTTLTHGGITREVHPTRITLDLDDKAFLSGTRMTRLSAIKGSGGMEEVRYILHVPDCEQIKVSVVSMLGGTVEATLQLDREEGR
ncbi:hypothetical protein AMJ85_02570 [candidate division BRC1 bacterium SM23_51]|nr:MAG: hypothetical protein AMJ85_02570 [candidate division BRC1 bacterium SM23_51]